MPDQSPPAPTRTTADPKPLRTAQERSVGKAIEAVFNSSVDPVETRIESFPKYVRRQHLTRFLAHYEIFKRILRVKGSIVECGVNRGFGLMPPVNLARDLPLLPIRSGNWRKVQARPPEKLPIS